MLRAFSTVSGFTLLSRILGLVRDAMILHFLGASAASDAWFAAFRFPNLFRRVFGEGAFNSAFVPRYSRKLEEEGEAVADQFASRTLVLMSMILGVIFILSFIFMGPITRIFAAGWDGDKFDLAVKLSRITSVYLIFVCLMAGVSGVLNSRKIFGAPAFAYVVLNIVFIVGLLYFSKNISEPVYVLAWCVVVAGVLQLGVVLIAAFRNGIALRPAMPRLDADTKKLGILMIPGLVSAGVQQLNLIVGQTVASYQDDAVTWIYASDRIQQFPLGMIGIAFGIVLLPQISRSLRDNRPGDAKDALAKGIEFALLFSIPAGVAMIAIPEELIFSMFSSGKFGEEAVKMTAYALMGFAFGSPAYVIARVLQQGFYAHEDTRTPMKFAIASAVANIILCVVLFIPLKHIGCAIATSLAGWVNVILLVIGLRKIDFLDFPPGFWSRMIRMILAALVMGAAVWGLARIASSFIYVDARAIRLPAVAVVAALGAVIYFIVILLLRVTSLGELKRSFKK